MKTKKKLSILFAFSLLLPFLLKAGAPRAEQWRFEFLEQHLKTAFAQQENSEQSLQFETKQQPKFEEFFAVKNLTKEEKIKILLKISKNEEPVCLKSPTQFDATSIRKIGLFKTAEQSDDLFKKVNFTLTATGSLALSNRLIHVTFDNRTLIQRQKITQELLKNPNVMDDIKNSLKAIAKEESEVLSLFNQSAQEKELIKHLYFDAWLGLDRFNQKPWALETATRWENIEKLISVGATGYAIYTLITTLNDPKNLGDIVNLALSGSGLARNLYADYVLIQSTINEHKIINYLHNKMLGVARYAKTLQKLCVLIEQQHTLAQMQELQPIMILVRNCQGDIKKLLDLLNTSTFEGDEATIFSRTGRVLAAYKLMEDIKQHFVPAILAVGELDAELSTATLLEESSKQRVNYCFPIFVENAEKPYFLAQEFWNPFLPADTAVVNSIEFGTEENPNNTIITGSNTGGKTTILKGIFLIFHLAQTLGIAPAKNLTMTPVAFLYCCLNINDDLGKGKSLFQAEIERARELRDGIHSLPKNQFSCAVIDEIFSGTSPKKAEEAATKFLLHLQEMGNGINVVSTHYEKPTTLEKLTQKLKGGKIIKSSTDFKNYKVPIIRKSNSAFERTFKLIPGVATEEDNVVEELLEKFLYGPSTTAKEEGVL